MIENGFFLMLLFFHLWPSLIEPGKPGAAVIDQSALLNPPSAPHWRRGHQLSASSCHCDMPRQTDKPRGYMTQMCSWIYSVYGTATGKVVWSPSEWKKINGRGDIWIWIYYPLFFCGTEKLQSTVSMWWAQYCVYSWLHCIFQNNFYTWTG